MLRCDKSVGFFAGDGGVALDDRGHHLTLCGDTKGERCDIKKHDFLQFGILGTGKQGSLDSSTVRHSLVEMREKHAEGGGGEMRIGALQRNERKGGTHLIRIDGTIQLFPLKELLNHFLDLTVNTVDRGQCLP